MRVRILIGVRALKGATAKKDRNGNWQEPEGGTLEHLDPGEIHELDFVTARLLISQHQAEETDDKITTRDPKRAAA